MGSANADMTIPTVRKIAISEQGFVVPLPPSPDKVYLLASKIGIGERT